jgi:hypothetical protein
LASKRGPVIKSFRAVEDSEESPAEDEMLNRASNAMDLIRVFFIVEWMLMVKKG